MLSKREIVFIVVASIILAFCISMKNVFDNFAYVFIAITLVILINLIAKKVVAEYYETKIETELWTIKKIGLFHFINPTRSSHPSKEFKSPLQAGVFLPILTTILTFGYITWISPLVFNVRQKIQRAAKRHMYYSFTEVSEYHVSLIAASGIIMNVLFAILGYLIGFPMFAKFNIYYAFFNVFPISELDGNKILFGSATLWSFIASFVLFCLGLTFTF